MLAQDPLLRVCAVTTLVSSALYVMLFLASRVVSWHWFAGYRRLPSHLRVDWDTRVPSTVHALVVTAVCTWELVRGNKLSAAVTGGTPGSAGPVLQQATATLPLVWRVSQTTYGIIGVSFAYFAVDLAVILRNPRISSPAILVHHCAALLSLASVAHARALHVFLMVVLLSEATTPFVNARWWLDHSGAKASRLYAVNGLALLVTWTAARIASVFPFYVAVATNAADIAAVPLHARVLLLLVPALLWCLNVMWWMRIVRGAVKLLRRGVVAKAASGSADSVVAAVEHGSTAASWDDKRDMAAAAAAAGVGVVTATAVAPLVVPDVAAVGELRKRLGTASPRRAVEVVAFTHPVH